MEIKNCSPRFSRFSALLSISLAVLILISGEAAAFLHRVGPINAAPSVGNFPAWYQDTTGLTLEFCDPKSVAEVAGGWCLLLPTDVPTPPEVFPTEFFDEHFYFAADAIPVSTNPLIKRAILVMAVESAFAANVEPGGQIAFSRIRVRLDDVPVTGTYRFIHPYGEEIIEATAGERIFFTDDVGIACAPGDFSCALTSRLGPFLLPSDTPGGAELPAVVGPAPDNNLYIADPARSGPVTGSTLPDFIDSTGASRNHNIFRIEGPEGSNLDGAGNDSIETTNFTLMGRIFSGAIPGEVTVDRANYARNIAGQKVEVYATGFETTQGRLPGGDPAPAVIPVLSFFDAPCASALDNNLDPIPPFSAPAGANETQMFNAGNSFWAQTQPAAIPVSVCVKDNVSLTYLPKTVGDEITITEAYFDPNAQSLSVKARSSDEVAQPTLTLGGFADLANGAILVSPLAAPPAHVQVNSAAGGFSGKDVTTNRAVLSPASGVTLTPSLPSPQVGGPVITFTAAAGGGGAYEYQFMGSLVSAPTLATAQSYSTVPTWDWNTAGILGGTYQIQVWARAVGSTAPFEATQTLNFVVTTPTAVGVTITPSVPSPLQPGNSVTFTATAGGGGAYEYQFLGRIAGGAFAVSRSYSDVNTWTWDTTGASLGTYEIMVLSRAAGSSVAFDASSSILYGLTSPTVTATLTPSMPSPQTTGATVSFIAEAGGGSGTYEYEFLGRPAGSTGPFGVAQAYSSNPVWTWPTTGVAPGSYEIRVNVRNVGSTAEFDGAANVTYVIN